jgi:iron complex outermembrane receptor protein
MKTSLLALSAALVATTPAFAQEADKTSGWTSEIVVTGQSTDYSITAATTATRTATPVEEIPQSIQTITRGLIDDQVLQNLTEALVNVSGVVPTSQAQAVLQPTLVRGFAVNTFIDGVPTYGLPPGVTDPATLVQVDRIEVAKGPSSTLYGGGSGAPLSGLINLVSRSPGDTLSGELTLRAGSFDTYGVSGGINLPVANGIGLRVDGFAEQADSFIDFVTSERYGLFPTLGLELGANTKLMVRGRYSQVEQTEYAGLPAELITPTRQIDRNVFAGARDAPRTSIENKAITGELTHNFSDRVTGTLVASRVLSDFEEWASFPFGQLQGTVYNFGTAFLPSDTDKTYVSGTISARLGEGAIRHTLLAGVDYDNTDYFAALFFNTAWATIDFANPLPAPAFGVTPPFFYDQTDKLESIAVFAQDQIALGDAIDVTVGLRWTRLKVGSDLGLFGATDGTYEKVTPRVGVTAKVANGISLFAGYAEGFQGVVGGAFFGLTPKPETSQAWEGGIKLAQPIPGLTGTIALYRITRQNVVTAIPNTFFSSQAGEQRAQGVELDLVYEPSKAFSLLANYAYTDAEVTKDNTIPIGSRLRAVPKHGGRLAGRYRVLDGSLRGFEIGMGITAVSRRELTLPNTQSIKGLTLVDAQVSYDLGPVKLGVSGVNLLGSKGFAPYQYLGGAFVTPTQPRSAYVTLSTDF